MKGIAMEKLHRPLYGKNKNRRSDLVIKAILLYFFVIVSNPDFQEVRMFYWSAVVLSGLAFLFLIIKKGIKLSAYNIWIYTFTLIVFASSTWSLDSSTSLDMTRSLLMKSMPLLTISAYLHTEKDFFDIMKIHLISSLVTCIYILGAMDWASLGVARIGVSTVGDLWNANYIGMLMAFSGYISFVLLRRECRRTKQVVYIIMIALFSLVALFSGSRKAMFALIFACIIYTILASKKYKLFLGIMSVVAVVLIFNVIMHTPALYAVLGSRVDAMFAQILGGQGADYSTYLRFNMIKNGLAWFGNRPLFGYGIANYQILHLQNFSLETYSHNNYIELLVGVGLIGAIIYYSGYVYVFLRNFKSDYPLSAFATATIVTISIIEVGLVSYYNSYIQIMICLCFASKQLEDVPIAVEIEVAVPYPVMG